MKVLFCLSVLFLFSFYSCTNKDCNCLTERSSKKLPIEYKSKIDSALFYQYSKFYMDGDSCYLDSALLMLNQAIGFYPELLPAYYYKSAVYESKGDLYATIETIDSAINKAYPNPDMLFLKAKTLDRLGRTKNADDILKETDALYSLWINCYPDSINLIITKIEFTAYYKGKDAAIKEINKYIKKYPNNDLLIGYKMYLTTESEKSQLFRKT